MSNEIDHADRFFQDIEDIEIVSRTKDTRTFLNEEDKLAAQQRVADGEDVEAVAEDVVFEDIVRLLEIDED